MSDFTVRADTRALSRLGRDIRRAAPEAWKAYRVSARAAAQPVLEGARTRAGFSTRIPQSGRIRFTSGGTVKVVFGGPQAPDAAPIENKGKGFVKHPTFGRRDGPNDWTDKHSHPAYLAPAFDAQRDVVMKAIEEAVEAAVLKAVGGK